MTQGERQPATASPSSLPQMDLPSECQLIAGGAGGKEPFLWFLRRQDKHAVRVAGRAVLHVWTTWRGHRDSQAVREDRTPTHRICPSAVGSRGDLVSGDSVRVRSLDDIRRTLDARGCCQGCKFLEPMARYCGQESRVLKRVECFYDEAQARMLRCKRIVLLEGVHCDGSGHPDTLGCDRMCFFFWRTEWLERLERSGQ